MSCAVSTVFVNEIVLEFALLVHQISKTFQYTYARSFELFCF